MYREIEGDLIELARQGMFDVIGHGCNCFCKMSAGIAPQMAKAFGCDKFPKEANLYKGDKSKLGTIDYKNFEVSQFSVIPEGYDGICTQELRYPLTVVNCYTQFNYGRNHSDGDKKPIAYDALRSCMKLINGTFSGRRVGLPKIGAGLAGGDWNKIKNIIQEELKDCDVTIVIFNK